MGLRTVPCGVFIIFLAIASVGAALGGDGVVALQTAAPSCPGDTFQVYNRYVNCGNGTVTDKLTGLVWLANANCFGELDWHEAMDAVAGLSDLPDDGNACVSLTPDECDCGLSDGSSPGEWRLPSIEEWEEMVEYADDVLGCSPTITNDGLLGVLYCWSQECVDAGGCSFYGVQSSGYWSSSWYVPDPSVAWFVSLLNGFVYYVYKGNGFYVWPVRGGQ